MADHDDPNRGTVALTPEQIASAEKEKAQLLAGANDTAARQAAALDAAPRAERVSGPAGEGSWPDQRSRPQRPILQKVKVAPGRAVRIQDTGVVAVEMSAWTLEEALAYVADKKREYEEAKRVLIELL